MRELFLNVLNASLYGSIVIGAVLILRLALKRAPRAAVCLLWLLAGVRLVLPIEIESSFSLQPDIRQAAQYQNAAEESPEPPQLSQDQEVPAIPQVPAVPEEEELPDDVVIEYNDNAVTDHQQVVIDYVAIAGWIWAAGVAAMGIYSVASYRKLKSRVAEAVRMEGGYWESGRVDTAFVLGFFRPRIYLPVGLTEKDRGLILAHEHVHIARGDHWTKLLGFAALAIHWFNPLVWVAYVCLCRDIEMACDERVVKGMDVQARKDYSKALLNCAGSHRSLAACPVAFGETSVKQRIVSVLNYRKPGFWVTVAAMVALVFVVVCLMTSPESYDLTDVAGISAGQIDQVTVLSGNRMTGFSDPREMWEFRSLLRQVRVTPGPGEEIGWDPGEHTLILDYGEKTILYFSEDCSQVWLGGAVKRRVENPEVLREWLAEVTDAVVDREVSGEPFAAKDEPAAWLRGVSAGAIREAEVYWASAIIREDNTSSRGSNWGNMTPGEFEELLKILNGLPEDAVGEQKTLYTSTFSTIQSYMDGREGLTVTFHDDVNGLVVILRMIEGQSMELMITDELDKVEAHNTNLDHPGCWVLEDRELRNFLLEMKKNLPIVTIYNSGTQGDMPQNKKEVWGLALSAENVSPRGMTLVCQQDGTFLPGKLMTGSYFRLEKRTEEGWQALPTIRDAAFTTEGWVLLTGQTYRWDVDWAWLYGELEPGDYRICKTISLYESQGNETDWDCGVYFTIPGETSEQALLERCREVYQMLCDSENYYVRFNGEEDFILSADGNRYYDGNQYSGLLYDGEFYVRITESFGQNSGYRDIPEPGWHQGSLLGYLGGSEVHAAEWIEQLWENYSWEDLDLSYRGSEIRDGGTAWIFYKRSSGADWEFVFDENGQFQYFVEGGTKVEIVTLEAKPIEAKLKALYEEAAGLGAGEHLSRCREALESFQAQKAYCLIIERQMSGDILNDNATQIFYRNGDDWLRSCVINEVDYVQEEWYLSKNGRQFTKFTTHHHHEGNGENINTGWVEGPLEENEVFEPWLRVFDWDAQRIDFTGYESDGTFDTISIRVQGKPSEADVSMEVAEYTVDFVFYRESRTLHQVVLRYTETWPMVRDGKDTTGVGHMAAVMTVNAAGEDMILQMLDAMYAQAITN